MTLAEASEAYQASLEAARTAQQSYLVFPLRMLEQLEEDVAKAWRTVEAAWMDAWLELTRDD